MSKADELLKKAMFFERLALYSDRSAFLQAIAQREDPSAQLSSAISEFNRIVRQNSDKLDPSVQGMIADIVEGGQYPQALKLMNRVFQTRMPNDIRSQLTEKYWAAQTALQKVSELAGLPPSPAQVTEKTEPTDTGIGTGTRQKETAEYPAINRADQQAVFNFAITQGRYTPQLGGPKIDGALGPETRKALEGVKDYFARTNPQNPRMTDQQAITAAKFQGR